MKFTRLHLQFGIPFGQVACARDIWGDGVSIEYFKDLGLYCISKGDDVKWLEKWMVEWGVPDVSESVPPEEPVNAPEKRQQQEDHQPQHRDRNKGRKA